jgi:protein SCO1/2
MRRNLLISLVAVALLIAGTAVGVGVGLGSRRAPTKVAGVLVKRSVPPHALSDATGRRTTLAAFRGKIVVLAPFLTLCREVCPLTTGAFEVMRRAVDRAGLGGRVAFVEVSVDPWRDSPRRLRAFARLTGIRFALLTGTKAELARFWRTFGVAFWRTREGRPADRDWLTGRRLTFDVSHTDALFLIDARGWERIADIGTPQIGRRLPRVLRGLLNSASPARLQPSRPGWTVQQGLDDIGYLLGSPIPGPVG